ncbi:MAG: aspartate aminotransferase family protein [Candidatus Heimdallarchaeota archaeon]
MSRELVPKDLTKEYTAEELLELEKKYIAPAVAHYYEEPLVLVAGEGATLEDIHGNHYIDFFAGICTTLAGYAHPKLVATLKWQAERLIYTSSLYSTIPYAVLAEKLAKIAPKGLTSSFIVSSGSEANEAALFAARKYKKNPYIVACIFAYHGRTTLPRELSTAGWRTVPEVHPPGVRFTTYGYCYRCHFGKEYPDCDFECARFLQTVIESQTNNELAAFITEPIQGVGGIVTPPLEYFKITKEIVEEFDGLFISDEVQTGFGRTGKKWWGIEHAGIIPDFVTMAKGFGSGVPIAGFLTKPEYVEEYTMLDSFATFGGNPLACAAACAVIEIIEENNFLQKAATLGEHFKQKLEALQEDHPLIGEVRGQGMMIGIELVKDPGTKEPGSEEMVQLMEETKKCGLLIGKGGRWGNVIRIQPPLELSKGQIDEGLASLDEALSTVEKSFLK